MKKVGRNEPCPCGSGKKFKKCCEKKMIGKRFMATKIKRSSFSQKKTGLTSFFQKNVTATAKEVQEKIQENVNRKENDTLSSITEKKEDSFQEKQSSFCENKKNLEKEKTIEKNLEEEKKDDIHS